VRRHWKRWLIGGIVLLVALVVGGPFAYFHFIEGTSPKRLTLSSQTSTTGAGAGTAAASSAPLAGTWSVTNGSQAGYRVDEVLFGQSHTAVGRTSAVTGKVTFSGTTVSAGTFSVDLTQVSSDQDRRDRQFQGRIMDTSSYPTATFTLTQPIDLGTAPAAGVQKNVSAKGNLTIHGATRAVTVQLQARRDGNVVQVSGSIPVTFADWNIPNPSFGPVTTDDHGVIEFLLKLTPA